jgi:hypothetical protein
MKDGNCTLIVAAREHNRLDPKNIAHFRTRLIENNGQLGTTLRENETTLFENRDRERRQIRRWMGAMLSLSRGQIRHLIGFQVDAFFHPEMKMKD